MPSRIGAVILAAGASTRLGQPKQLLAFRGEILLTRAINAALGAPCFPVIVVLGARAEQIRPAIESFPVQIVVNADWEQGMGGSLSIGVSLLAEQPDIEAVVALLCDQPLVTSETIRFLLETRAATHHAVIASEYDNLPGPPCVFDRALFPELIALKGSEGARKVIAYQEAQSAVFRVPVPDAGLDIDTLDDWKNLQKRESSSPP